MPVGVQLLPLGRHLIFDVRGESNIRAVGASARQKKAPHRAGQMHRVINQERFSITSACGENEALRGCPLAVLKTQFDCCPVALVAA